MILAERIGISWTRNAAAGHTTPQELGDSWFFVPALPSTPDPPTAKVLYWVGGHLPSRVPSQSEGRGWRVMPGQKTSYLRAPEELCDQPQHF